MRATVILALLSFAPIYADEAPTISWEPVPCVYVQQWDAAGQAAWGGQEWPVYLPSGETMYTAMVGQGTGGFAQCLPDGTTLVIYTGCHECEDGEAWDNTVENHDLAGDVCSNGANFHGESLVCDTSTSAGDDYCSQEWCTSHNGDCWAGTEDEACTCSQGQAKLTGETRHQNHDENDYYVCACAHYSPAARTPRALPTHAPPPNCAA